MPSLYKLESQQENGEWQPHVYPVEFRHETTDADSGRLCITCSTGQVGLLLSLSATFAEPLFALFVLALSRCDENHCARYQSPKLTRPQVVEFLERFKDFFERDGRHRLWIHAPLSEATLVYDNHNVIYAYGPLAEFRSILQANGYHEVDHVAVLGPHGHCYHAEFDPAERAVIAAFDWSRSPLKEQDDPR